MAGGGIPLLAVLVAILIIEPYYGVVDDATLLSYVSRVGDSGFFSVWADSVRGDIGDWGMVRPFYWALAYLEYRAGAEGATALYVVNWAALGAILAFAGYALARAFRVTSGSLGLFLGLYGAAVFVYPWTLDLFAFASYQEKWVILAAAICFLWFAEQRRSVPEAGWYVISVGVVTLGSLTKAQFLVFVPAFLLLTADAQRRHPRRWLRVGVVTLTGVAAAVALRIVAAQGEYTQGYGLGNIPDQIGDPYLLLPATFILAWTVYAFARRRRGTLLRDLVPTVTFASFVAVFAQWPGGFLYSVIGFVFAGAFALAVVRVERQVVAAVALVAAVVWACTWIWVRTDELYSSLASIGEFARSDAARTLAVDGTPLYVSCEEGSGAIASYVGRAQHLPLEVRPRQARPWSSAKDLAPPPGFDYALVDARLCPAAIDKASWQAVWTPSREGGFTLYRRR